jgi:phosphate starvation-inducible protein PhoH
MVEEVSTNKRLTRKEKRTLRQKGNKETNSYQEKFNFNLKNIEPLTQNQKITFESYNQGKNLMLLGSAGSGKTFLAIYLSLLQITENNNFKKLYICRSAEPSKSVGFLPGGLNEKIKVYESPYISILTELYGRGDAYNTLKYKNIIEFISTSYIRGMTLEDCIIIVDETQNLEWNELYAIMTRIGKNCKIIFCGDYKQSDLKNNFKNDNRKDDILKFINVISKMKSFMTIEFTHDDIIRSKIVKEFIINVENLGY